MLRRTNTIETVQASCAIEGNQLSVDQVTALLEGKTVVGSPLEVQEVRNALLVYELSEQYSCYRESDMLSAHAVLMKGLIDIPGGYRRGGVGIKKGNQVMHIAPPAENVRGLMKDLFQWLQETEAHPLIASSVFHYEFIHPFADGNGRMGRLWQTLILKELNPLFQYAPIETLIREEQAGHYSHKQWGLQGRWPH